MYYLHLINKEKIPRDSVFLLKATQQRNNGKTRIYTWFAGFSNPCRCLIAVVKKARNAEIENAERDSQVSVF